MRRRIGGHRGGAGILRSGDAEQDEHARAGPRDLDDPSLLEALSEAVIVRNTEGHVLASNELAREMIEISDDLPPRSEAKGRFVHEDGSPFLIDEVPYEVSRRTGDPQREVVMGVRQADRQVRWFSVNSFAMRHNGERRPYATVESYTDITEQRITLRELNAARVEDLRRLALVSEYRNAESHTHTERVARSTALIAMALGLDRDVAWTIARAAPLHDVGKVGLRDSIVFKRGRLTPDEFEVMKRHTSIGAHIIGESEFRVLQMGREIALTHHERSDGKGYPDGLRGAAIPISGRIVAVADAFDAMTHSGLYKEAIPVSEALAELTRCRGAQFDPPVVDAFLTLDHETLVEQP